VLDCAYFFDELFENNFLGSAWHKHFRQIFQEDARFVVCLLDKHYLKKLWPTFERECFLPRVEDGAVIPIFLDDTIFPGIPRDIVGIAFPPAEETEEQLLNRVIDEIALPLGVRLGSE
jgi:hypothetical protein